MPYRGYPPDRPLSEWETWADHEARAYVARRMREAAWLLLDNVTTEWGRAEAARMRRELGLEIRPRPAPSTVDLTYHRDPPITDLSPGDP